MKISRNNSKYVLTLTDMEFKVIREMAWYTEHGYTFTPNTLISLQAAAHHFLNMKRGGFPELVTDFTVFNPEKQGK